MWQAAKSGTLPGELDACEYLLQSRVIYFSQLSRKGFRVGRSNVNWMQEKMGYHISDIFDKNITYKLYITDIT